MSADAAASSPRLDDSSAPTPARPYTPPTIAVLGTLADLTLGGVTGAISDGFGNAGDEGSI
jgi:hypothetical protein